MAITNSQKTYTSYSALTTYAVGDIVIYLEQLYRCKLISFNHLPTDTTYWTVLWSNSSKS